MHERLNAPVAPAHAGPEPVSADECEWILDVAARFASRWKAPGALAAHLEAIADVLANGESAAFDAAVLDDLAAHEKVVSECVVTRDVEAHAIPAVAPVAADLSPQTIEAPVATAAPVPEPVPAENCASPAREEACVEAPAADLGSVPAASPLFPRGMSSQQRRKRSRGPRRCEADEASGQLALPLESEPPARVAVSHFAERMLRARERLATEEPTTAMGASAEVLSFAERLKKVRERLAGEDSDTGRVSA